MGLIRKRIITAFLVELRIVAVEKNYALGQIARQRNIIFQIQEPTGGPIEVRALESDLDLRESPLDVESRKHRRVVLA
jgi:hypothetical protein